MVVIRLSRGGNRNRPYYYIVATDSHARRDGKFIEQLGFYNPIANEGSEGFRCNMDRVDYWIGVGAQMSSTVKSLVSKHRKK